MREATCRKLTRLAPSPIVAAAPLQGRIETKKNLLPRGDVVAPNREPRIRALRGAAARAARATPSLLEHKGAKDTEVEYLNYSSDWSVGGKIEVAKTST